MSAPAWHYDEMVHVGKDFSDFEVVEAYDARHRKFRQIDKENEDTIAAIGLQSDHIVADFGCGTGNFALMAARRCRCVYAIDISRSMLDFTKWKAEKEGIRNIEYCQGGFLTYEHKGQPLDAISTSLALHHLPDFWKQKALRRLNAMLKDGGRLYLADVVFEEKDCEKNIQVWIDKLSAQMGEEMRADISRHVAKEYSTFSWIMEGLLVRAGFRIERVDNSEGVYARYLCVKSSS